MTTQLDQLPEAQEGEEIEKVASGLHGVIGSLLNWHLSAYVYPGNLGYVFNSNTSFKVVGEPPTRQPDVAFVALERMSTPPDEDVPFAPDLAVEVVSKNDTAYGIEQKVSQYLQSEVRLIWVIYPVSRTVAIYRPASGLTPQIVNVSGDLDGEDVLPGFKVAVKDLFK
jgi:Uma2 family endonuclease